MKYILIGNALCLAASVIMTLLGFIKKKRNFLMAQCVMNGFFIAGNSFLGGISGVLANCMTIIRNVVCMKWNLNLWLKLGFVIAQIGLAWAFGCTGVIAWLPIIGNCVFTWYMDTENMVLLKWIIIGTQLLWAIYDFSILNYTTFVFDVAAVVTNFIGICSIVRERKAKSDT